jgi:UDP-glucuronate decarboxylase
MKKNKKVMVTGGAGFVGSHLCERLLLEGNDVLCVDNLSTGRRSNIEHLLLNHRFKFLNHNIIEPIFADVDEIFNLACPASPAHYQRDPIFTTMTSVFGSSNLLELSRKNNCRILQASTSEIYGDPDMHPQHEGYWGNVNPIGIRSCYDEGKRCAESCFFFFYREDVVQNIVVCIFNTYGPKMAADDGRVVSNFIVQALLDQDITVYGDGSQTRSFQYVSDLVEGLLLMMSNERDFVGPVNLGNPVEFSIRELADEVFRLIPNSKSKVVFKPLPSDDPCRRKPDVTTARDVLNWNPKVSLQDGLLRTIDFFRGVL